MSSECKLVGFSVVLVANSNNPSIINPDFLRYNKIVDETRVVHGDPIAIPGFSQVTFEGGVSVSSDAGRVSFDQNTNSLANDGVICQKMAKRYLETVPHVPYSAIGINPKGYRISPEVSEIKVSTLLVGNGAGISFKDVTPELLLKTVYRYEKRMIVLEIVEHKMQEKGNVETSGILFQANIHRDISVDSQQKRIEMASRILESWENDASDFYTLVSRFDFGSRTS